MSSARRPRPKRGRAHRVHYGRVSSSRIDGSIADLALRNRLPLVFAAPADYVEAGALSGYGSGENVVVDVRAPEHDKIEEYADSRRPARRRGRRRPPSPPTRTRWRP